MAPNRDGNHGNWILDAMPREDYSAFLNGLEPVELGIKDAVHEPGASVRDVYFPVTAVFSTLASTDDGGIVEVATLGNEGMVGLSVFLGQSQSPLTVFSQVPGVSWRAPVEAFHATLENGKWLPNALRRYTQCLMVQISQGVVCNARHDVVRRCARWILMTFDRVHGAEFFLTQEFLSQMLGVRRASVNEAAASLQERRIIEYTRGKMKVLDRNALEAASCDCYRKVHAEYERFRQDIRNS